MAIADDFSVAVNGDIRYTGTTANYTVLALHRFLQDLADDIVATGNDLVDITSDTPSDRSTDNIITLLGSYNIDDTAAEHLFAGSITQSGGATVYSGLQVLGAVNNSATQLMVVQDNKLYQFTTIISEPFWGDQSTGGLNGNAAAGILMRCLIKTRVNDADIDGKRIRVQARHWGDSYDFFNVTMGQGESVAAIGTTPDPQNDTTQGTVTAYTHILNANTIPVDLQDETSYDNSPTTEGTFAGGTGHATSDVLILNDGTTVVVDNHAGGVVSEFTVQSNTAFGTAGVGDTATQFSTTGSGTGFSLTYDGDNIVNDSDHPRGSFQTINLNNGNGAKPYYSGWTYGADTSGDGLKGLYEYVKDLVGYKTAKTLDALNGELFLGITHEIRYDNETGGPFFQHEKIGWGTKIFYDGLSNGPFTEGNYVVIGANNAGRVIFDDGVDELIIALENPSATFFVDNEVITEYEGPGEPATTTTAVFNDGGGSPEGGGQQGGTGLLLALDDNGTTGNCFIQLLTGAAPVDNLGLRGLVSGCTANTNTAPVSRTVPKMFLGTYTGTLIGAFGIGVVSSDLTASDTVEDLGGNTQTPPNNVTFTVTGLVSGEDRVLVGPRAAGVLDKDQLLTTFAHGPSATTLVMNTAIPSDTPASGTVRVANTSGVYANTTYTSYTANTFTLTTNLEGAGDVNNLANTFISYIDELAGAATASFTAIYSADRDLFVRVRDGGATPIKTFESPATLTDAGGTIAAIRTTDA